MSTHTPAPWRAIIRFHGDAYVVDADMKEVGRPRAKLSKADARLIAAAPDLLDLAKDIAGLDHRYLAQGDKALQQALREWKAAARAAIAKAEGTS